MANTNLLPNAFLQLKVGLPKATKVGLRIFPNINVDNVELGLYGVGVQHEFSRWIKTLEQSPVAFSGLLAFTHLYTDYNFHTGGEVLGDNQRINIKMDSWLFELIGSTKFNKLNEYGGFGYLSAVKDTLVRGTYDIQNLLVPLSFTDPFDFQNNVDGLRASIGLTLRLGLNTAYTLQGYNNFSIAMNFNIK